MPAFIVSAHWQMQTQNAVVFKMYKFTGQNKKMMVCQRFVFKLMPKFYFKACIWKYRRCSNTLEAKNTPYLWSEFNLGEQEHPKKFWGHVVCNDKDIYLLFTISYSRFKSSFEWSFSCFSSLSSASKMHILSYILSEYMWQLFQ